jgi:hypothetical protein
MSVMSLVSFGIYSHPVHQRCWMELKKLITGIVTWSIVGLVVLRTRTNRTSFHLLLLRGQNPCTRACCLAQETRTMGSLLQCLFRIAAMRKQMNGVPATVPSPPPPRRFLARQPAQTYILTHSLDDRGGYHISLHEDHRVNERTRHDDDSSVNDNNQEREAR